MTAYEFLHAHWFISAKYIAEKSGIGYGVLRHYYTRGKIPSDKQFAKIKHAVKEISKELYINNCSNDAIQTTHAAHT